MRMISRVIVATSLLSAVFGLSSASADHTKQPGYEPSKVCRGGVADRAKVGVDPHAQYSAGVCIIESASPIKGALMVGVMDTNGDGRPDGGYVVIDGDSTNGQYVVIDARGHIGVSTYPGQEFFCDFGNYEYGHSRFCGFQ